jgi:hypothetical protein
MIDSWHDQVSCQFRINQIVQSAYSLPSWTMYPDSGGLRHFNPAMSTPPPPLDRNGILFYLLAWFSFEDYLLSNLAVQLHCSNYYRYSHGIIFSFET